MIYKDVKVVKDYQTLCLSMRSCQASVSLVLPDVEMHVHDVHEVCVSTHPDSLCHP